ncbi:sugar O-acetyltransferase [Iodobacter ciconiae]|uniref:Acetyltransferase n=1 Tax=Iodobacter ciconiae TaxID=2496266 RepID=A0A3S8ZTF9_9NEIS|nr:sugar O-acetyltransferase [Iodobacter ciconiae]AZN36746.1 sugar O-acetyltransferase [Iodobacter ciconiae]
MSEADKMCAGQYYNPDDKELVKMRVAARLLSEKFNRTSALKLKKRTRILKSLLGKCGKNIYIEPTFNCDYGSNIYIGKNFFANFGLIILDAAEVRIGDNCFIAPQVGIYTATHPIDEQERIQRICYAKPIYIGDSCWIGGHVTINPGVTLGNNVVVASGAVVTKSFGDNVIIAGNPAKIIRHIEPANSVSPAK